MKRTLTRCHKFEDSGISCFSEPALQDIIFSTPPHKRDAKADVFGGSTTATNTFYESSHQMDDRGLGMSMSLSFLIIFDVILDSCFINLYFGMDAFVLQSMSPLSRPD